VEKIKAITFNVDGKTNIQFKNGEINFPLEYYFWNGKEQLYNTSNQDENHGLVTPAEFAVNIDKC
jgi:hypothetical protein